MLNHLLLSLILTGLFYFYNQKNAQVFSNTQYAMTFLGIAIGLALVQRFMLPPGTALPSVTGLIGLEDMPNGPNGDEVVACYKVPYKVEKTQYGDTALLAGYNEDVAPYFTGAVGKFEPADQGTVGRKCTTVNYAEEKV